jgi:L-threonylcarbamoyladenylate synthase
MEIFTINNLNIDEATERAVALLRAEGVIALPTDTVYGLAADARNDAAIEKVFALKGRDAGKALPIFVSSLEMLEDAAFIKDERVRMFLEKVWPGAVTAVLPARGWLPLRLRGLPATLSLARRAGGALTIAVRIPDDPFVRKVIEKFGGPITGTSANLSGHPACLTAADVEREFKHLPLRPAALFSHGGASAGVSSTIVDCTVFPPKILRIGAVSEDGIIQAVNQCAIK